MLRLNRSKGKFYFIQRIAISIVFLLHLIQFVENLVNLSNPPTEQELQDYEDVPAQELPSPYKRSILITISLLFKFIFPNPTT